MANWLFLGAYNIIKCINIVHIIEIEFNRGEVAVQNGKTDPSTLL